MKMYFIEVAAPWKPARYVEATLVGTLYASDGRRRYKVGTSAFSCLRAANRQRRRRLQNIVADTYIMRFNYDAWLNARRSLQAMPPDT